MQKWYGHTLLYAKFGRDQPTEMFVVVCSSRLWTVTWTPDWGALTLRALLSPFIGGFWRSLEEETSFITVSKLRVYVGGATNVTKLQVKIVIFSKIGGRSVAHDFDHLSSRYRWNSRTTVSYIIVVMHLYKFFDNLAPWEYRKWRNYTSGAKNRTTVWSLCDKICSWGKTNYVFEQ